MPPVALLWLQTLCSICWSTKMFKILYFSPHAHSFVVLYLLPSIKWVFFLIPCIWARLWIVLTINTSVLIWYEVWTQFSKCLVSICPFSRHTVEFVIWTNFTSLLEDKILYTEIGHSSQKPVIPTKAKLTWWELNIKSWFLNLHEWAQLKSEELLSWNQIAGHSC